MARIPDDLKALIAEAIQVRSRRQGLINGYLKWADPVRPRIGDSITNPVDRSDEVDDRFDSTLEEVGEDFAADLIGRVMPRDADWVSFVPVDSLAKEEAAYIKQPLQQRTTAIFDAIRASNFYEEAAGEWAWDQGHGTSSMISYDPGKAQPLCFEAIPPAQLLLLRGHRGLLTFQGRQSAARLDELVACWPKHNWPADLIRKSQEKAGKAVVYQVTESATLIPDPADLRWQWRVTVGEYLIHDEEVLGRGACPILTTRWRTFAGSPWGYGPLLKAVPTARIGDQLAYLMLKQLGKIVDPPFFYDDDGVTNVEGGIDAGAGIPRLPGSKQDFWESGRPEVAYFEQAKLQDAIRRAGFQNGPRQKGLTPPTLGQWMDEKAEEGRRLELPTGKLYAEGVVAIIERVEHLLLQRGEIDPAIKVRDKFVRVKALNPLARQQDYEKASTAQRILDVMVKAFGPQGAAAMVDGQQTAENLKQAMNDKIVILREPDQADPLLRGVLGQPGMAPGLETAPPGAAPAGPPAQ